jgi:DNA-binding NtrC family response regulator
MHCPTATLAEGAGLVLYVAASPDAAVVGRRVAIDPSRATVLGRAPLAPDDAVTAPLDDPRVSRVHACVTPGPEPGQLWLRDCGSANGSFVNALVVRDVGLHEGDVVRLGDTVLVVCREGGGADADNLGLAGDSAPMVALRALIHRVGPSPLSALIVGATGTGKELVAQALHRVSGRAGPFVALNCAALPGPLVEDALFGHRRGAFTDATSDQDGAFVRAHGGTLFLDEIGDLALDSQPKLLRALETREVTPVGGSTARAVDLRVVVATHVPLEAAMREGRFREDLYARLAGVVLSLPTLAERREDIGILLDAFLPEPARARPRSADFVEALLCYGWPRNVRELAMLAERLCVLFPDEARFELGLLDAELRAPVLARAPAAASAVAGAAASEPARPGSRLELEALLDSCGGNVTEAARLVHRSRKQLYRWMDAFDIARGSGRRER